MHRSALIGCIVVGSGTLFAQGITLSGTGYSDPSVITVAPGQITTLFVAGLKTVLPSPAIATDLPLPTTLAGISVTLNQTGSAPIALPVVSIQQRSICEDAFTSPSPVITDCLITAISVQIPFELVSVPAPPPSPMASPKLVISENGTVSKAFRIAPVADNLHVIRTCDSFPSVNSPSVSGSCLPLVTHADGTLVTVDSPAHAGEEVVIWAYGLGQTSPVAKTGNRSPSPAVTVSSPTYVEFDFRVNAMPSPPFIDRTAMPQPSGPTFVGLAPGQVGLYQINLRIPNSIPSVDSCGNTCSHVACTRYNTARSNLTINIGANFSFDGAAICVEPPR